MIILDTHIWVKWILEEQSSLSEKILGVITGGSHLVVSAISCFEVSMLAKRGKLELPLPVDQWLQEALYNSGVDALPVTCDIMQSAAMLPDIHRDPADRIIIATALLNQAQLVSLDSVFPGYEVLKCLLLNS